MTRLYWGHRAHLTFEPPHSTDLTNAQLYMHVHKGLCMHACVVFVCSLSLCLCIVVWCLQNVWNVILETAYNKRAAFTMDQNTIVDVIKLRTLSVIMKLHFRLILLASVLEIDQYIGLPIFSPIFKHFTIIGYRFWKKRYISFFFFFLFFVTYTIIQSITSSEMCSLYLTHLEQWTLFTQEKLQHGHRM